MDATPFGWMNRETVSDEDRIRILKAKICSKPEPDTCTDRKLCLYASSSGCSHYLMMALLEEIQHGQMEDLHTRPEMKLNHQ